MLDYKLIEALAAVAREGGFERAARRLHITQSAVSQRVRLLEEQTGQVLLARSTPPQPTAAGRRMMKHFLQVKQLEDDLLEAFTPDAEKAYSTLAVGINGDSLATWFPEAAAPFLRQERVLLDLRSDDQEETHRLLKDGEVVGCISARKKSIQGCRIDYLGRMDYRLVATPDFALRWFPNGLTPENISRAPLVVFNRKDTLHTKLFRLALSREPLILRAHYLPSSERFVDFILNGLAFGMLPDQQNAPFLTSGRLVDLAAGFHVPVNLYWHCWNLKSRLLEKFSSHLVASAREFLPDDAEPWQ